MPPNSSLELTSDNNATQLFADHSIPSTCSKENLSQVKQEMLIFSIFHKMFLIEIFR